MNTVTKSICNRRLVSKATAMLVSVCLWQVSNADSATDSPFRMMVIEDMAQGELVMAGEYSKAIEMINADKSLRRSNFEAHNNLCVAYTKAKLVDKAAVACDAAIAASTKGKTGTGAYRGRSHLYRDKAIALSNRGALRAATGDMKGALEDLELSVELNDRLNDAAANLRNLKRNIGAPDAAIAQIAR